MNISPAQYQRILFFLIVLLMNTTHNRRIPVNFYDFHADPKTEDFVNCVNTNDPGTVQNWLDKDGKPVLKEDLNCI